MTLAGIIARLQDIVDECDDDAKRAVERLKLDIEIAQRRASDVR